MATNTMRTSIHTTTPATSPAVKVTAAGASEEKKRFTENEIIKNYKRFTLASKTIKSYFYWVFTLVNRQFLKNPNYTKLFQSFHSYIN